MFEIVTNIISTWVLADDGRQDDYVVFASGALFQRIHLVLSYGGNDEVNQCYVMYEFIAMMNFTICVPISRLTCRVTHVIDPGDSWFAVEIADGTIAHDHLYETKDVYF
jgi:hypothetical protein